MRRIFIVIASFICLSSFGQAKSSFSVFGFGGKDGINHETIDFMPFHLGFHLGVGVMDFGITPSNLNINGKYYRVNTQVLYPSFLVGFFGDVRLGKYFNLRLQPSINFGDRLLSYRPYTLDTKGNPEYIENEEQNPVAVQSVTMLLPLYLKFGAAKFRNYRPYLIFGGGASFELNSKKNEPVLLSQNDFFIDFGVGCTFYFKYFRLSPEIKFLMGFNDILVPMTDRIEHPLDPDKMHYTPAITKLSNRLLTICFNFE